MKLPSYEEMRHVKISSVLQAQKYIGKKIFYLKSADIDQSGRGYYFVKCFYPIATIGREWIDITGSTLSYKEIVRILVEDYCDQGRA